MQRTTRTYSLLLCLICYLTAIAHKQVEIQVVDSVTLEPIPYAAIFLRGTGHGTLTDNKGTGIIKPTHDNTVIDISMMGYSTARIDLAGADSIVIARLQPVGVSLAEVTVKKKKEHYSKRNNKAVLLMERVRKAIRDNLGNNNYYTYDKYEKITLALNRYNATNESDSRTGNFAFLNEYVDTSDVSGSPILNISVKEKLSTVYNKTNPKTTKEVIKAINNVGIDQIVDQGSIQTFLNDVLREVDIYNNDVNILQNRFVSPLANIGADFYKYYITDTIGSGASQLVEMSFVPRTSTMFGFTGKMYIATGDSSYLIKKTVMSIPQEINLNFVDRLHISQEYEKTSDGSLIKKLDDMTLELSIIPGTQGLHVRRLTILSNQSFLKPENESIFRYRGDVLTLPMASKQDENYWNNHRPSPMAHGESRLGEMIKRLRNQPLYYWSEKILKILVNGYIATSAENSKFDIGPVNTMISGNDIEGIRLRIGGMTTANLSRRWFGRGYLAYGTKDKKLKYRGELEYSFIDKEYHSREFPVQSLRLTHLYDVDMIGQHYMFTNPDNVFLAWKRMKNRLMTYHRVTELLYTHEVVNNFTFTASLKHERQESTAFVPFTTTTGHTYRHYGETTLSIGLRYAPGEKFFQTKTYRIPVNLDAPIFVLEHTYGPANFAGNTFEINRTECSIQKRFWFSAFGYLDCLVRGGHVWSATPYPSLLIPNANLSYTIQPESFALMDPMEFISDSYASWYTTYWANGAILNFIPLIKRLKLREVFSFRGYIGSLSVMNTPSTSNNLYQFPAMAHATPMHGRPYMEISAGLDNVIKCLRIDYVWRLSYRHTPGVDRNGIRIAFHATF